jgi:transcriptional regulator with XRE-family HTH domain
VPRIRQASRKDLGAVLRELRNRAQMTQERVEHASGLHRTYVSSAERGERNVSFEALGRWLAAVGASWREFGDALDRQVKRT